MRANRVAKAPEIPGPEQPLLFPAGKGGTDDLRGSGDQEIKGVKGVKGVNGVRTGPGRPPSGG
jgi:hypothetical protein